VIVQFTPSSEVRNSLSDLDSVGSEAPDFQGIVGHQVDFGNPDIAKHVGTERVFAGVCRKVEG
jgi:hypothetical protein